jgi:hypothetical protein
MAGKLGWATLPSALTGKDISELVSQVSAALLEGPVALGFEAPLWTPKRSEVLALTKARQGEGSRSWSAGAGTGVLATGLAVIPYILTAIRESTFARLMFVKGLSLNAARFSMRFRRGEGSYGSFSMSGRSLAAGLVLLPDRQVRPASSCRGASGGAVGWQQHDSIHLPAMADLATAWVEIAHPAQRCH